MENNSITEFDLTVDEYFAELDRLAPLQEGEQNMLEVVRFFTEGTYVQGIYYYINESSEIQETHHTSDSHCPHAIDERLMTQFSELQQEKAGRDINLELCKAVLVDDREEISPIFYTSNSDKASALHLLSKEYEFQEIQGTEEDIIKHKLSQVTTGVVSDMSLGFYCLDMFPGPYIKAMVVEMGIGGISKIISRFKDRRVCWTTCMAMRLYNIATYHVVDFPGRWALVSEGRIVDDAILLKCKANIWEICYSLLKARWKVARWKQLRQDRILRGQGITLSPKDKK